MKHEIIATCAFGLEAVLRREVEALGLTVTAREDGRITFEGSDRSAAKANLWLRTADKVLLRLAQFPAYEFEDLFQGVKGVPWEQYVPEDANFVVNGSSVKSKLSSVPACQSVAEKALVARLSETYGEKRFAKSGARMDVYVRILNNMVTVGLDTTGPSLHKRGYRVHALSAPIKETLASAILQLSFWKPGRILVDPFCGTGTFAIEAAMLARGIAPGLQRRFAAEDFSYISEEAWKAERSEAYKQIDYDADLRIYASDISAEAAAATLENAEEAGVDDCIEISRMPFGRLASMPFAAEDSGIIITNPPYGKRIGSDEQTEKLYAEIREFFAARPTWSLYLITSDKDFEKNCMGRPADRRRKLFNGNIETTLYQYYGAKV
jgi:putative N6-adenine-specific DNA methylase